MLLEEVLRVRDVQADHFEVGPLRAQRARQAPDARVEGKFGDVVPLHSNGPVGEEPSTQKELVIPNPELRKP